MSGRSAPLPSALRAAARWMGLGPVPALVVHPGWDSGVPCPVVLWMHGRTAHKEIDPGRYLRWMRAGIGACAVDLPGHGERPEPGFHEAERTFEVVARMAAEVPGIVAGLMDLGVFDAARLAIGGVSAGGMAALLTLCGEHAFSCSSVEACSGSWRHPSRKPLFGGRAEAAALDPIARLDGWREVPFQAMHARHDQWIPAAAQEAFVDALRRRYRDPGLVEFVQFDETGAPHEHVGFGRLAAEAKNRQAAFFTRWLG